MLRCNINAQIWNCSTVLCQKVNNTSIYRSQCSFLVYLVETDRSWSIPSVVTFLVLEWEHIMHICTCLSVIYSHNILSLFLSTRNLCSYLIFSWSWKNVIYLLFPSPLTTPLCLRLWIFSTFFFIASSNGTGLIRYMISYQNKHLQDKNCSNKKMNLPA